MNEIRDIIEKQREYFKKGETLSFDFRCYEIKKLKKAVIAYEKKLMEALNKDLGKSEFEAYETEFAVFYTEVENALSNIRKWMRTKTVKTPIFSFPAKSRIYATPKGVVLIMSPWNYPVLLTLSPLLYAIAAGNCAVVKPSRYSKNVSSVLKEMINEYFNEKYISIFEGGSEVNTELLSIPFDHIFFTGSPKVGKVVMKAAAEHLSPVTLELGGKSPCIVDDTANIDITAKKIIWGKCVNAGQTCIAPDYVLLHSSVKTPFLKACVKHIKEFFGDDAIRSPEYPKIINKKHFTRLTKLLENEEIYFGGGSDENKLKIQPTIVLADETSPLMSEEIFGPILPIITVDTVGEAYEIIERHPHPLALYLFTERKTTQEYVIKNIQFGGGCINDTIMHIANDDLPFGGIRESGMGRYHGRYGFDTFTHYKPVVKKGMRSDIKFKYPPYKNKINLIKKLIK